MKKILMTASVAMLMATVFFTGCSSKEESIQAEASYMDPEYQGAPKWVLTPQVDGFVADVGSAPKNAANDKSFQRAEAMADARDNLARQIATKVGNMFKSFKAATGAGEDATFDKSVESVSKQISSETLKGSVVKETWVSKSQNLYVLMVIDTQAVIDSAENAVKTSFKNDKALYQKFLSEKAQGELTKELEKLNQ